MLRQFFRINFKFWCLARKKHGLRDLFTEQVGRRGRDAPAIHHLDATWTFGDVDDYSNQVGNYLLSRGFQKGDDIIMLMETSPQYIALWLGAAKVKY